MISSNVLKYKRFYYFKLNFLFEKCKIWNWSVYFCFISAHCLICSFRGALSKSLQFITPFHIKIGIFTELHKIILIFLRITFFKFLSLKNGNLIPSNQIRSIFNNIPQNIYSIRNHINQFWAKNPKLDTVITKTKYFTLFQ